jgi:hypothetical protein
MILNHFFFHKVYNNVFEYKWSLSEIVEQKILANCFCHLHQNNFSMTVLFLDIKFILLFGFKLKITFP